MRSFKNLSMPAVLFLVFGLMSTFSMRTKPSPIPGAPPVPVTTKEQVMRILGIVVWAWFLNYLYYDWGKEGCRKTAWTLFLLPYVLLVRLIVLLWRAEKKLEEANRR